MRFDIVSRTTAVIAAALSFGAVSAPEAVASERWRFEEFRGGGLAQSCGGRGAYTACATLSCGENGAIAFSLEDLSPGAPIDRKGLITVSPSGHRDRITWSRLPDSRTGGRAFVASGLNLGALVSRLKSGSSMGAVINDRIKRSRGEIAFTLGGSSRAIRRLEARCTRLAERYDGRPRRDIAPAPAPVVETSPWRYTELRGGGKAESCGRFGRRDICATLFCRRGGELQFGLDGLNEDRGRDQRRGVLRVGRGDRPTLFTLATGPQRDQDIYVADHPRTDRLAERLKAASDLEIEIEPRKRPLYFSLINSGRAINRLQNRCEAVAARRELRRERRDERRVVNRYRDEVRGRWGDRVSCRSGGWRFGQNSLSTPDGAVCDRIQVAELDRGPLAGGVAVRGTQCRGGSPRRRGEDRVFETYPEGDELILRAVNEGDGLRLGDNVIIQLRPRSETRRLFLCPR